MPDRILERIGDLISAITRMAVAVYCAAVAIGRVVPFVMRRTPRQPMTSVSIFPPTGEKIMAIRTIEQLTEDMYDDDEVRQAVIAHAAELGTTADIEMGRRTLPTPHDARTWYERDVLPRKNQDKIRRK